MQKQKTKLNGSIGLTCFIHLPKSVLHAPPGLITHIHLIPDLHDLVESGRNTTPCFSPLLQKSQISNQQCTKYSVLQSSKIISKRAKMWIFDLPGSYPPQILAFLAVFADSWY
jgi:hypothetical protein